ncbi:hypothetical protein [Kordia jejudonensis]|uniref:hypothetical protein n=1 Tax=Kordia jejudonensis TaxID=1348245 RepID=UPI000629ACDE|nr:hypothetical protein [Kordia jejudonensis]
MKKQTLRKLSLKKAQISKLENINGGMDNAHDDAIRWPQTCLGDACPFTMFFICPSREAAQ